MKDQETIARFIQLRAEGWSFARIASELNVSKPTLIQWGRQYQFEIQNLRAVETEALAEKLFASREKRWQLIGEHLSRVEEELAKRTLDTIPTARLISLASKLRSEISLETGQTRFSTAVKHIPKEEFFEDVLDWRV
jgi:transposase